MHNQSRSWLPQQQTLVKQAEAGGGGGASHLETCRARLIRCSAAAQCTAHTAHIVRPAQREVPWRHLLPSQPSPQPQASVPQRNCEREWERGCIPRCHLHSQPRAHSHACSRSMPRPCTTGSRTTGATAFPSHFRVTSHRAPSHLVVDQPWNPQTSWSTQRCHTSGQVYNSTQ